MSSSPSLLLDLAGGTAVDDLRVLEGDAGLGRVLRASRAHDAPRVTAGENRKQWRKPTERSVPSPSAAFRYLKAFHDADQENERRAGKAFIPAPTGALSGLGCVNGDVLAFLQANAPCATATLDMDATLVETSKEAAFFSYRKSRAYQPLSAYWFEQDVIVATEFRGGNVPAGHQQLRVFEGALAALPVSVERVRLRSDAAGYQRELLAYCAEGKNERFGIIDFTISVNVTQAFRDAIKAVPEEEWLPLSGSGQEWAEVCSVPNWAAASKTNPDYRYLAVREPLRQQPLFLALTEESEAAASASGAQEALPFPRIVELPERGWCKVSGLVTNLTAPGEDVIRFSRERCGKSEEAHAVLKHDLAGGQLPSSLHGVNAAWWAVSVLAFNLNSIMKRLAFLEQWQTKRLKNVRYHLIDLPGRVIRHARALIIRLAASHPANELLITARARILALVRPPPAPA